MALDLCVAGAPTASGVRVSPLAVWQAGAGSLAYRAQAPGRVKAVCAAKAARGGMRSRHSGAGGPKGARGSMLGTASTTDKRRQALTIGSGARRGSRVRKVCSTLGGPCDGGVCTTATCNSEEPRGRTQRVLRQIARRKLLCGSARPAHPNFRPHP